MRPQALQTARPTPSPFPRAGRDLPLPQRRPQRSLPARTPPAAVLAPTATASRSSRVCQSSRALTQQSTRRAPLLRSPSLQSLPLDPQQCLPRRRLPFFALSMRRKPATCRLVLWPLRPHPPREGQRASSRRLPRRLRPAPAVPRSSLASGAPRRRLFSSPSEGVAAGEPPKLLPRLRAPRRCPTSARRRRIRLLKDGECDSQGPDAIHDTVLFVWPACC